MIDIENRLERAALELLAAYSELTGTTGARNYRHRDTSHAVAYPCAIVQGIGFAEFGRHTGWYAGALRLTAQTYRQDDADQAKLDAAIGSLRDWAQQTDLASQLNGTTSAKATATKLDVRDIVLDGGSEDGSTDKINETTIVCRVICRPTQATTTA